ncbi:MAG: Lrp/AsnC family transcriptional regulator [Promethearchaeia archaeon]
MVDDRFSNIDKIDIEILKLLTKDARKSFRQIERDLKDFVKSPITVKKHVESLQEKGIIQNYGAKINYEQLGFDIISLIEITISKGKMLEVERDIAQDPNIFGVLDVTGEYDAIILARFRSRTDLSDMVKKINSLEYVIRTNTHLILNVIKEGADFSALMEKERSRKEKSTK